FCSTCKFMEEKPCSSSAADGSIDVAEEAKKLIGTGNRHLVMGDVVSAVSVFQEACAMLAERYGDTADECGEAFFLCGKSLLELARMENTVLGNALEGVPEESSEEGEKNDSKIESADNLDEKTRDELRAQVYDAMSVGKRDTGGEGQEEKEEGTAEEHAKKAEADASSQNEDKTESALENAEKTTVSPHKNEEKPAEFTLKNDEQAAENEVKELEEGAEASKLEDAMGTSSLNKNDGVKKTEELNEEKAVTMEEEGGGRSDQNLGQHWEHEEEEVGNLQLAWEMLEVAKVIYKRKENKEDQLMAAQILLKLGEVGAESGNYTQALEDFQECLTIQLEHLPPHSRLLAETHYQLGMTFSYTAQYTQAIQHFTSSIQVIESRLAMLQEAIDKAEEAEAAKEEQSELEELKQLLPEIAERVEDAKESQRTAAAASQAIHQTLGGASTSSAFPAENGGASSSTTSQIEVKPSDGASSSKSTLDISHLVRKKRKPEDESPKKDSDAKKVKQETTVNGSGDSASNSNGVQEKMEQEAANSSSSVETSA
uniref:Tetratricopeptide SHNi-TPR domain-containing protein n=1 Tax=Electrophorus electricus TaxID=8005 RepID=A0A4W4FBY7_ELEEL